MRYRNRVTDSFWLREVNAEEKPELFFALPKSVEMGRVNGTLLLLGFPRLVLETDVLVLCVSDSGGLGLVPGRAGRPKPTPFLGFKSAVALSLTIYVLSPLGLGGQTQV